MSALSFRLFQDTDLDALVDLDRASGGVSRRGFMEKRLAASHAHPESFISVAALDGNDLIGFGFCHVIEGEYGGVYPVAVLDAIGVAPERQGQGLGHSMMEDLIARIRERGAQELRTQARWDQRGLLDFFARTGFSLEPRLVLECSTSYEPDHADTDTGEPAALSRDRILIRSLESRDIDAVVRIDQKITGRDRRAYYERKFTEVLQESGIRISMVAENDDQVLGFIMARVDYGEFGQTDTVAVLDTLGVAPGFREHNVGRALTSQLFANLRSLRVELVRTSLAWNDFGLSRFLERCGFWPSQRLALHQRLN